jgi:hypothetical protein
MFRAIDRTEDPDRGRAVAVVVLGDLREQRIASPRRPESARTVATLPRYEEHDITDATRYHQDVSMAPPTYAAVTASTPPRTGGRPLPYPMRGAAVRSVSQPLSDRAREELLRVLGFLWDNMFFTVVIIAVFVLVMYYGFKK